MSDVFTHSINIWRVKDKCESMVAPSGGHQGQQALVVTSCMMSENRGYKWHPCVRPRQDSLEAGKRFHKWQGYD